MKKSALRQLDLIDKATLPLFAITMLAEYAALRKVPKRTLGDLYDADDETLSGTHLPGDELVPLGYERKDTVASLAMLAGNIAFGFATLSAFSKFDKFLFKHRRVQPLPIQQPQAAMIQIHLGSLDPPGCLRPATILR